MKKAKVLIKIALVVALVFSAKIAEANLLHGTVWQYGDEYDRIGFYDKDTYILIAPDIAYPDPPYWSKHYTKRLYDVGTTTYFTNSIFPLPLGYTGYASMNTEKGRIFWWIIFPFIHIQQRAMILVETGWTPNDAVYNAANDYVENNIFASNEEPNSEKMQQDIVKQFFKQLILNDEQL